MLNAAAGIAAADEVITNKATDNNVLIIELENDNLLCNFPPKNL